MAATVNWETVRTLAGFRAQNGCAITLYLDLDPTVAPTAGDAQTRVNSLLAEGERAFEANRSELTHEQREGVKADLERLGRYLDEEFDRDGSRGLAVFAAGLDNVWAPLPLADAVPDQIKVGTDFYLAPLVPLIDDADGALVAVVGREQGHVYRLRAGRLEEVADHTEDQPRRHDQGGWSQARYQRHIDNLAAGHMRTVAEEIDGQVRRRGARPIVVVCAEETRTEFGELLSQESRAVLAGWTTAESHANPTQLLEAAVPVLEEWRSQHENETLERWREERGRDGRATAGWAETLEAASDGRVDVLLFREGANRPAFQCPACGRASATEGGCPLDGEPMEARDEGLDLAVHQTLAHGGSIATVRYHDDLDAADGVGALLRY